ncbi:LytTR family DNA-binding domain-containing protein [Flavihumibacter cheonanensis]|uniref:LytR/AlgR family response regulator transcription factor n=1 Tax=Flavihumibacter cheonanensis TaxID=1442385 RepID=UPI001EF82D6F|nr:LytTR family DNA-binding domain-containing protein [Flavihumibacter cheonanensis]MCG7753318.1 LytTR family DNA-binding domain-containing protein [Flavihumibacter cheonanensis]
MDILIIEDEQLGVEKLMRLIKSIDESIQIVGNTRSIKSSVEWLMQHEHPDIILMDIELTDGQSFEIFSHLSIKSMVIFTTSYDEYALQAFKVNSVDYLLKPIKKEELKNALDKFQEWQLKFSSPSVNIKELINGLRQQQPKSWRSRFLVKQGQKLVSIETSEIAYLYAEGRLSYFITWDKQKFVLDYTIEELEEMLDPQQFYRANRAFIIHIKTVSQIHNYFNGKLKLELQPATDKEVLISREKAAEFKDWMGK